MNNERDYCKVPFPETFPDAESERAAKENLDSVITFAPVIDGDSATRKALPLCSGVLDYFSAALVAIADVSRRGNDKHNPGQPLHWARGKSSDHADCIARHLLDRGTFDAEGVRHSASLAWRALALLQEELEREAGAPVSRGSR